jgi:hypothetical protein
MRDLVLPVSDITRSLPCKIFCQFESTSLRGKPHRGYPHYPHIPSVEYSLCLVIEEFSGVVRPPSRCQRASSAAREVAAATPDNHVRYSADMCQSAKPVASLADRAHQCLKGTRLSSRQNLRARTRLPCRGDIAGCEDSLVGPIR